MDIWVLDRDYSSCGLIDSYESFIWAERYNEIGDFELYSPVSETLLKLLVEGRYLYIADSDRLMVVESIRTITNVEDGNHLKVTGRSLECYLERRIIWGFKALSGNMQYGLRTLLNENAISPSDSRRQLPGLEFESSNDSRITSKTLEDQYLGDNLLEVIQNTCVDNDVGFKILPDFRTPGRMIFSFYCGDDHSYDQTVNPWVVFSPGYENLLSTNSLESKVDYKTTTLVAGEEPYEDDQERVYSEATISDETGFDRREMFTNASDISQKTGEKKTVTDEDGNETEEDILYTAAQYDALLKQRGNLELAEHKITKAIDGEVEPMIQFLYGKHFKLGDIVQVCNEYGLETKARITEVVITDDQSGYTIVPTFTFSEDL